MESCLTKIMENCTVDVQNATDLTEEQFANIRRNGIGASDASVILGTNPWANIDELIEDKLATGLTSKNLEISAKPNVRKGHDLEPLILMKAEELLKNTVTKPTAMYRFKQYPWLTVNFDGITYLHNQHIPVEAKMVSAFGEKGWNWAKSWTQGTVPPMFTVPSTLTPAERCGMAAEHYGIPPYYYCQLQQQMMALGCGFGMMAALRDKTWELVLFMVHRDNWLIQDLIKESRVFWNGIAGRKGMPIYETLQEMKVQVPELAKDEDDY